MFRPAYFDKEVFRRYVAIVEANEAIQDPGNFHDWVFRNYARSLLLVIRKIADPNRKAVSLNSLLGQIVDRPVVLTSRSFTLRYPEHHRDLARQNWVRYCGQQNCAVLPKSVAHEDLDKVKHIAARIVAFVNKEIAHHERQRRYRTIDLEDAHRVLDDLLHIFAKYGDLCGTPVPDPYDIADVSGWDRIFKRPWLEK